MVAKLSSLNTIVWTLTGQVYTDNTREGQIGREAVRKAGRGYYRIRIRSKFAQHEIQLFLQITFSPHLCYRLSTSHLDIKYHQHFRRLKAMDEIDNETSPPLSSHLSGTIYYYTNIVRQGLM